MKSFPNIILRLVVVFIAILPIATAAETINQGSAQAVNLGLYGGEIRDLASDPNSDFIYVSAYSPNGFFVSDDNGATWQGLDQNVYDLGEPRGVEIDEDGNVYLLISDGLFKSTDNGTTLTEIGTSDIGQSGITFVYADNNLIVGDTQGRIITSSDKGETFATSSEMREDSYVLSVAAVADGSAYYAVLDNNTDGQLYISTNGIDWSAVDTSDITNRYTTIAVDPNNSDHLIMLSYGEDVDPWQSLDGGVTWDQFDVGGGTPSLMTADSSGRIYLGTAFSDDGGETWDVVNSFTPANRVSTVWPDSSNDDRLYGSTFGAVAISEDRGENWIDSNEGITAVTVHDVSQSTDKDTVWMATNAGLAKTTNFTDETPTWEFPINYDYYPNTVWVSPDHSDLVLVGGYEAIYRTTDGGESWDSVEEWNSVFAVQDFASHPNDPTRIYAVGGIQNVVDDITGVAMMSTDSGLTWTDLAITDDAAGQAAAVSQDGMLFVGAGALDINGESATGIYKYDSVNWEHLSGSPDEQITSIVAHPDNADILYATASDFNSYQQDDGGVYKTTDGGDAWTLLSTTDSDLLFGSKYRAITIQGSTDALYVAGTSIRLDEQLGALWKSTDGGKTWSDYYYGLQNETFNTLLFDGLIAGNSRGAYELHTKVNIRLRRRYIVRNDVDKVQITATVTDGATHERLANVKMKLYKKKGNNWKKIDTDRTNSNGVAKFIVRPIKSTRYKIAYTPKGEAVEEYAEATSGVLRTKIKR